MTYGEIKKQIFLLLGMGTAATESEIGASYKDFEVMIPGAINRAFADVEHRRLTPLKTIGIDESKITRSADHAEYSISDDIYEINRVIELGRYGERVSCLFAVEGDTVLIFAHSPDDAIFKLEYFKKIKRVNLKTDDATEIDLPQDLAELVPYYAAADIYGEDEPAMADKMRENYLRSIQIYERPHNVSQGIKTVYSCE